MKIARNKVTGDIESREDYFPTNNRPFKKSLLKTEPQEPVKFQVSKLKKN